jgi:hypothetical protein
LATLTGLSLGLVFGLVACRGAEHPGDHATGRRGEVDLASDSGEGEAVAVGEVDDVL